ncbi:MAG: hypothetical protein U9R49_09985 [Bacteroidota bacterium]|nr:hypothetical protein [Bacteroidota bacterium]
MRFSIQPEPRPEQRMRTVTIDEIVEACENDPGKKPILEHYFSPTKKQSFIKEFLHYLNTGLLDARHGNLHKEQYLAFILSFQFTAPLLEIPAEKELGLFYRLLKKTYKVEEVDLNLHFSMEQYEGEMVSEKEALEAFRSELGEYFGDSREVKESVQKRVKKDALESIMEWQREHSIPVLAEAFGRTVVIPSFFSFTDRRLLEFYRKNTEGITYRVAVPDSID